MNYRAFAATILGALGQFALSGLKGLPVLGVLNWLMSGVNYSFRPACASNCRPSGSKRRRLRTVKSLNQNRVASMVLFVSEEFALFIDRCHSCDASETYGVCSSVQIRAMSEFRRICHLGCSKWKRKTPSNAVSFSPHSYAATILGGLGRFAKRVLHITALPCVGLNGTVASIPHTEQLTCVSILCRPPPPSLLALQDLQCLGSLANPFSR